jgi:hypothetical protein
MDNPNQPRRDYGQRTISGPTSDLVKGHPSVDEDQANEDIYRGHNIYTPLRCHSYHRGSKMLTGNMS